MSRRDELLTVPEVCAELGGVSRRTFYRWRELGRAPTCIQLPNLELRVWRSDLMTWLDSRREGK
ncbi:helix-turn-helix domain-containing protein [Nonomuraea muscovyensis]|uniref:helix-turn-helix transcriptional regulator n=1 Tax=Nonomuraea muscovyensis TaxID=1124761 RepID=UPI0033CE2DFD